jgi:hypothetical protein
MEGYKQAQNTADSGQPKEAAGAKEIIKRDEFLQQLVKAFGEEDAKKLCFVLGIDYDDLPAQGRRNKLRELISQLERENRIDDIIGICKQERPQYNWDGFVRS